MSRSTVGVMAAVTMSWVLPVSTEAVSQVRDDEQVAGVCTLAADLNQQARPQDARALLDEHRAAAFSQRGDCATEYFAAQARTSLATIVSTLADDDALVPLRDQLTTVCEAPAGVSTRSVALAACDKAVSIDPPKTWSERASSALEKFTERWTAPLESLGLAVLGLLAAIYVLARVWTRRLQPGSFAHLRPSSARRRLEHAGAYGLTLLASVAFLNLLVWAPSASGHGGSLVATAIGVVVLAAGAARVFAGLLASAFRVSVTARGPDGAESPEAAARAVARLNELGARPPRGAQYPSGTDVSALDTAVISALPTGAFAKVLIGVVNVFLPRAPWEVLIDKESADRETVQVRHNGHLVSATVVDRDLLALRTPAKLAAAASEASTTTDVTATAEVGPDLHRVSAGIVLAEFHKVHRLPGLGGATNGTSIGLQAVATTDFARNYDAAVPLLARAVGSDSGNLAATLALLHYRFRDATTAVELAPYDDELETLLDRLKTLKQDDPTSYLLLSTRAELNQVVARINRAYARDGAEVSLPILRSGRKLANDLLTKVTKHLQTATTPADALDVLKAIHHNVEILAAVGTDAADLAVPLTPLEHHQTACHFATAPTSDAEKAIHHLRIASADPRLAAWRAEDPQLRQLRRTAAYLAAFPPEKAQFFSLPGITRLEDDLTRLGITSEHQLLAHHPAELGRLLGLTRTTTARLVALARLVSQVPADLHKWRFTIAKWIADAAPTTRPRLIAAADDEFAEKLDADQIDTLKAWVGGSGLTYQSAVKDYLRAVQ